MPNKLNILIIDDDKLVSEMLADCLTEMGATVGVLHDGNEGLKAITETTPDLVLLDLKLPTLSGVEILKELKKQDSNVPVIVITGYKELRKPVFEAEYKNMVNFLYKPIDGESLEMLIRFFAWRKRGGIAE